MNEIESEFARQGLIKEAEESIMKFISSLSRAERLEMQNSLNRDIIELRVLVDESEFPVPGVQNLPVSDILNTESGELKVILEHWNILIPEEQRSSEDWTLHRLRTRMGHLLQKLEEVSDAPISENTAEQESIV